VKATGPRFALCLDERRKHDNLIVGEFKRRRKE
jgi:hypothetical protein